MFETSFEDFAQDQKLYKTIPIISHVHVDTLTPIDIFHALQDEAVFILESHDQESTWSNFSFIGLNPLYFIREKMNQFVFENRQEEVLFTSHSISELFQRIEQTLHVKKPKLNIPFIGGAVGSIGYEAVTLFEKVPNHSKSDVQRTKCELLLCETIIAFDHHKKQMTIIHYETVDGIETNEKIKEIYAAATEKVVSLHRKLKQRTRLEQPFIHTDTSPVSFESFSSNYKKTSFMNDVEKIKEYIRSGDIFQAVLSQRFEKKVTVSAFQLYRALRIVNPSPYLFYIKLSNEELIGSSPERLIHVLGDHLEIHPIAGTRRRGNSNEEDQQLATQLIQDKKELAEHYMLVDLARNDIGRVASYGSVQTPQLLELTYFSHVMHLISKVTGRLKEDIHPMDALISSFPAGTVSGAPKVRAMQILHELEPTARGSYAGCVAYIGFDGNIDSCITIRTISLQNGVAYVQAGAGIVADSKPELEWKETINKASALIKTIEIAEQTFKTEGEDSNEKHSEKVY